MRFLVIGGKDPVGTSDYYNTAYVVGTNGEIVFRQAKSVPIQFFKDGLPAPKQKVWNSPWGKIGICICYDLSYTRVTDRLVEQGAQLLIVPTMDLEDWGRHQHELHSRVAPVRAAEYGIPIFRLASSGISQAVTGRGNVIAKTSFSRQRGNSFGKTSAANRRFAPAGPVAGSGMCRHHSPRPADVDDSRLTGPARPVEKLKIFFHRTAFALSIPRHVARLRA